jgi:hypothetical protein
MGCQRDTELYLRECPTPSIAVGWASIDRRLTSVVNGIRGPCVVRMTYRDQLDAGGCKAETDIGEGTDL